MANESGTAAVVGWLNPSLLSKVVSRYLKDHFPMQKLVFIDDLQPGTDTASFSRVTKQTALSGTITELSGLSNTVFQTSKVTAQVSEVGVLRQFTKKIERTSALGVDGLHSEAIMDAAYMCLEKFETDLWAEAANPSTSVGTSGSAYKLSDFSAGITQLTINKAEPPYAACLTTTQVKNMRADIVSSGAAVLMGGANGSGDFMQPVGTDGYCGAPFGLPTFTSNLAATASADKLGMHMTIGRANPSAAATGVAMAWLPEVSMLANPAFSGGLQVAVTMCYGMVEKQDGGYVKDISIA